MYTATFEIENILPRLTINLNAEMTTRQLIEAAFIQLQTDANPDPFKFVIQYYGYGHFGRIEKYLGYFIVSVNDRVTDDDHYWELVVNGQDSDVGIDSHLVRPGDRIVLKWKGVGAPSNSAAAQTHAARVKRSAP